MRVVLLLCMGTATGCAERNAAPSYESDACDGGTVSLVVEPATLVRGDESTLEVRWQLGLQIDAPMATLAIGNVEVDLPLLYDPQQMPETYVGRLLAEAKAWSGCAFASSATTSFVLE